MIEIFFIAIIWGIIWGIICMKVADNKGIDGGIWFLWGVLFGIFALIIVATKPYNNVSTQQTDSNINIVNNPTGIGVALGWECPKCRHYNNDSSVVCICGEARPAYNIRRIQPIEGGWKCRFCGRTNADYVGTCGCGRTKEESRLKKNTVEEMKPKTEEMKPKAEETKSIMEETKYRVEKNEFSIQMERLELLKKYKELFDMGAVTQEEFENKKKEIMG